MVEQSQSGVQNMALENSAWQAIPHFSEIECTDEVPEFAQSLLDFLLVRFDDVIKNLNFGLSSKNLSVGKVHHFKCPPKILSR